MATSCNQITCAIVRFLCGFLDRPAFLRTVDQLDIGSKDLRAKLQSAPANPRKRVAWGQTVFQAMGSLTPHLTAVALAAGYEVTPVAAFLAVLDAVEQDDKALFAQVVGRHLKDLSSCRAVCTYLHNAAAVNFKNSSAAQRFGEMANAVDYCDKDWSAYDLTHLDAEDVHVLVGKGKPTLGYRTLLGHGARFLAQKEECERRLLSLNASSVRQIGKQSATLYVLRRFNSFSPVLNYGAGFGGGYFFWTGYEGIAIDPGFDFIKNYISAGFALSLINRAVITHAHPDHLADVPSLLTLLFERSQHKGGHSKNRSRSSLGPEVPDVQALPSSTEFHLYMSVSAYEYLAGVIGLASNPHNVKLHVIEPGQAYALAGGLRMYVCRTIHRDCVAQNLGVGVMFKSARKGVALIYTSDTAIDDSLIEEYRAMLRNARTKSHVLLANIGGVHEAELNGLLFFRDFLSQRGTKVPTKEYRYPNHLGIIGLAALVHAIPPKAVLIGEIGAEMAGERATLENALSEELATPCLIADLGLCLRPFTSKCYALNEDGKLGLYDIALVKGIERDLNMLYVIKDVPHQSGILNAVSSDLSQWRRNLPSA